MWLRLPDMWLRLPPRKSKKIGYVKQFLPNMNKIKVVQNCIEWRGNWSKTILEF